MPIVVEVAVEGPRLTIDFTGTGTEARGAMNVPPSAARATVYYAVKALLDPELMANSGMFRGIEIVLPEASLVNPRPPAACGARSITCNKIARALFRAFAPLLPAARAMSAGHDIVPAIVFSGPRPGDAGGDTWGDLPLTFRAGGDSWIPGSFDPATNLTYHSTSQAKPWARISRKTDGDALYTNSVLALDARTGQLQWFYQFTPGETHDLDDVFESVLIDYDGRRSLFKMGKLGILWELDRVTGEFRAAHDLGYQNVLDVDPATGQVTYRADMIPEPDVELEFCPDLGGVRNWRATSYHPETGALYIPIHPTCVTGMFTELDQVEGNDYYADRGFLQRESRVHPASGEHAGHLIAMDIRTGELRWRYSMATRPTAAALSTGGGLVFGADTDRHLYAHDAGTGEVRFRTRLPGSVQGFPITYAVDGRQYLAAPVGGDRTNAIYVFALPDE